MAEQKPSTQPSVAGSTAGAGVRAGAVTVTVGGAAGRGSEHAASSRQAPSSPVAIFMASPRGDALRVHARGGPAVASGGGERLTQREPAVVGQLRPRPLPDGDDRPPHRPDQPGP